MCVFSLVLVFSPSFLLAELSPPALALTLTPQPEKPDSASQDNQLLVLLTLLWLDLRSSSEENDRS